MEYTLIPTVTQDPGDVFWRGLLTYTCGFFILWVTIGNDGQKGRS